MGQDIRFGGGDIQPLKDTLDRRKIFGVSLCFRNQSGIFRILMATRLILQRKQGKIFSGSGRIRKSNGRISDEDCSGI